MAEMEETSIRPRINGDHNSRDKAYIREIYVIVSGLARCFFNQKSSLIMPVTWTPVIAVKKWKATSRENKTSYNQNMPRNASLCEIFSVHLLIFLLHLLLPFSWLRFCCKDLQLFSFVPFHVCRFLSRCLTFEIHIHSKRYAQKKIRFPKQKSQ